eukprot:scaffold76095_cov30-Tisochrysis_lutea.AAC.1
MWCTASTAPIVSSQMVAVPFMEKWPRVCQKQSLVTMRSDTRGAPVKRLPCRTMQRRTSRMVSFTTSAMAGASAQMLVLNWSLPMGTRFCATQSVL